VRLEEGPSEPDRTYRTDNHVGPSLRRGMEPTVTTTEDPEITTDEPDESEEAPEVIGPPDDPDAPEVEF
jgi:hypothetical protein